MLRPIPPPISVFFGLSDALILVTEPCWRTTAHTSRPPSSVSVDESETLPMLVALVMLLKEWSFLFCSCHSGFVQSAKKRSRKRREEGILTGVWYVPLPLVISRKRLQCFCRESSVSVCVLYLTRGLGKVQTLPPTLVYPDPKTCFAQNLILIPGGKSLYLTPPPNVRVRERYKQVKKCANCERKAQMVRESGLGTEFEQTRQVACGRCFT